MPTPCAHGPVCLCHTSGNARSVRTPLVRCLALACQLADHLEHHEGHRQAERADEEAKQAEGSEPAEDAEKHDQGAQLPAALHEEGLQEVVGDKRGDHRPPQKKEEGRRRGSQRSTARWPLAATLTRCLRPAGRSTGS